MVSYTTDNARWIAVQTRDALADGEFMYGVATTGIYCYPSCPSRRPLINNTRFFDSREQAIDEGFRACRRCLSDQAPLAERQQLIVEKACRFIETSPETVSVEALAEYLNVSRFHLQKLFKRFLCLSPKQYVTAVRAKHMERALSTETSVTDAVYKAGYNSASAYYRKGTSRLGMSASRYQKGGQGMRIGYAFGKTRFGKIIVATTDRGICSVLFGESQQALKSDLESRFPKAELIKDPEALAPLVEEVVSHIEQPESAGSLPMDIQGTAFQEKVWQALRNIKPGRTATYTQIACKIGRPKAARAVATACAANPIAVLVPCHRVVRASGELSGYRWGLERKRELIDSEKDSERESE